MGRRAGADELPDTADLSQLPPQQQTVTYYAALPGLKPFTGNFAQPGQATKTARFVQANQETPISTRKPRQPSCPTLKKTVRLVSEFEPRDPYICFPLLRLRRATAGGFEIDTSFVAPSLSIGAALPYSSNCAACSTHCRPRSVPCTVIIANPVAT